MNIKNTRNNFVTDEEIDLNRLSECSAFLISLVKLFATQCSSKQ